LFLKIDVSNKRGFSIIAFYLKEQYTVLADLAKISSIAIQPILFLSKLLGPIEKNYRLTELEVTYLVYTAHRLRVML
jgi:uncharacterized protein YybS (DUF2232 family)